MEIVAAATLVAFAVLVASLYEAMYRKYKYNDSLLEYLTYNVPLIFFFTLFISGVIYCLI